MTISGYDSTKPNTSQTIGDVITSTNANEAAIATELTNHEADLTAHGLSTMNSNVAAVTAEVDAARGTQASLSANLGVINAGVSANSSAILAAQGTASSLAARLGNALDSAGNILLSSLQNKWLNNGDTPTFIDTQHFSVPNDRTKVYIAGAILRLTISGSYAYAPVASSVFSSSVTTVTLDPNYMILTSGLSLVEIGLLSFDYAIQNNVATLLSDVTTLTAQIAAIQQPFRKNLVMNGGCMIAQRGGSTINLSTTATAGQVDGFSCWATGTAVSAGTITQDTAAPVGRKGYALKVAGATITGTGVVLARARIEAKDALQFKNQTCSFSLRVYQDTGASVNYTIVVRTPSLTSDDFSSVAVIGTSTAQAVATATDTLITYQGLAMGDTSKGVEIEVQAACGAVTTKDFWFAEWNAEEGAVNTPFEYLTYEEDRLRCQRRLWVIGGLDANEQVAAGMATSTTAAIFPLMFPAPMRVAPSLTVSAASDAACLSASGALVACTALSQTHQTRRSTQLSATVASGLVAGSGSILQANATTNTRLTFSAEL